MQNIGSFTINEIHCGDSAVLLKQLPPECIDLTVTSPPYDNLRKYKGFTFDFETIASQLYRVTKSGGVVVWVVGDATVKGSETGTSFKQALFFKECGFNLHDTMIYLKRNPPPQNHNRYEQSFEYMFVLSKGKPKTFNVIMERSLYIGSKKNRALENKSNIDAGSISRQRNEKTIVKEYKPRKNVFEYAVGISDEVETQNHTAPFPENLPKDHILSWSNEGDLVLDCFVGSGTTLKMAKMLNRNYIGFDISQEYCEIAKQRIDGIKSAQQSVHLTGGILRRQQALSTPKQLPLAMADTTPAASR